MGSYVEEAEGKYFTDFVEKPDFQRDLVKFFSSDRYGMSKEEMLELGPQGLAEKFVEHMRWQDTNEATALMDYNYVQQENAPKDELKSFGNLMTAYDRAEGGGTGMFSGAVDYMSAFATSPSTLATVATGGWGFGSKLAAKASGKALQMGIRQSVNELVRKGVALETIKDTVAGTVGKKAVVGGVTSAIAEGALGAGQAKLQGETREVTTGNEYTNSDLLRDAIIAGTIGGSLGSAARAMDTKTQRSMVEKLVSRDIASTGRRVAANEAAKETLSKVSPEKVSSAADRSVGLALNLKAREKRVKLDPLDPKLVEEGNLIKKDILAGKVDNNITGSLSTDTLRSVTAATVEIIDKLDIKPNERISSAVTRALGDPSGKLDGTYLEGLRDKYNLSREQMSYIYLSDFSEAGRTLAEASYLSKVAKRAGVKDSTEVSKMLGDLDYLSSQGIVSPTDVEVAKVVADTYNTKDSVLKLAYRGAQAADASRIALMTSQLGTTAANTVTSGINLVVDLSDQFWKNMARITYGEKVGDRVQRRWVSGSLSTIKGMTLNRDDALLFREVFFEEMPEQYSQLFYEAARAEDAVQGTSRVAKVGRTVNVLNSSVDSVFKQAVLYSSVDRQLRELANPNLGQNLGEFLGKNMRLENLPEGVMDKAVDDARRFTFSRSYKGDKSTFGKSAQFVIDAHRKVPFLVSAGFGTPFPRYMANHLEHINDYTPIGILTGGLNKLDPIMFGDTNKTGLDRFARQVTGASMFLLGAYSAASTGGTIDYDKIETETNVLDMSRVLGPYLMPVYLGDLAYRKWAGLPQKDVLKKMKDIAAGSTDLGMNTSLITEILKSEERGEVTENLARSLGDIIATYTYPLTPTRDFVTQVDPSKPSVPYTRDVFGGDPDEVVATGNFWDTVVRRATRFLPEVDFLQYSQSYNGKTAIPYYGPPNETPVGSYNPISKQFGMQMSPKPNELQKEASRLNLEWYELYKQSSVLNSAVDVHVREILAKNLPRKFIVWREQVRHEERFVGKTYDDITNEEDKRLLFEAFIKDEISAAKEQTEVAYQKFKQTNPKAAAGYIRNLYTVEGALLEPGTYDKAVSLFTNGDYKDAEDYLGSSADIPTELVRREEIMDWANRLSEGFKGFPKIRDSE